MDLPHLDRDDRQEVRLAVVMTGGVSLAVWMGGVTLEIRRLVRGDAAWGDLLDLMGATAVVDIVSGTSAGGINGALLAAATISDLETEQVAEMRETWIELGSLDALLRPTSEANPPSLLRGDDHLLPELARVLRAWLAPACRAEPDGDPAQDAELTLLLTASLLDGDPRVTRDDVGSLLSETEHLALFRFEGHDLRRPGAANRLAVAARTSASFPGAFEASFLAVGPTPGKVDLDGAVAIESNRWAVDGGVIMNQPIEPALDAMYAQPARNETRRVLLSIEPDPGPPTRPEPADPARPPSVRRVLGRSILDLPRQQSVAGDLEALRATNERVETQQRVRRELVHEAARSPGAVEELAGRLYPVFVARRNVDLGRRTADRIAARASRLQVDPTFDWVAVERAMDRAARRTSWLPDPLEDRSAVPAVALEHWPWGISGAEYAVSTVGDLVRRVQHTMSLAPDDTARARRAVLRDARSVLNRIRRDLGVLRSVSDRYWHLRILAVARDPSRLLTSWADDSFASWPIAPEPDLVRASAVEPREVERYRSDLARACRLSATADGFDGDRARWHLGYLVAWLATLVAETAPTLEAILDRAATARARELQDLVAALRPPTGLDPRSAMDHVADVLVSMLVIQVAVDGDTTTREQTAELVQVSGEAESPLDPSRRDPATKLAGSQAAHFGAFYKRSWRANDWTWGRLDGAARLARVALNPRRLAQRVAHLPPDRRVGAALGDLERVATALASRSATELERHWRDDRDSIERELAWLATDDPDIPGSLPCCIRAVTRRLHHEILHDELPRMARAVRESRAEGADVSAEAHRFERAVAEVLVDGEVPGSAVHEVFDAWRIGAERLTDETDTPLFISTVTRIAAVTASAGQGSRSGLGLLRFPLRPLRGLLRLVERAVASWVSWRR